MTDIDLLSGVSQSACGAYTERKKRADVVRRADQLIRCLSVQRTQDMPCPKAPLLLGLTRISQSSDQQTG